MNSIASIFRKMTSANRPGSRGGRATVLRQRVAQRRCYRFLRLTQPPLQLLAGDTPASTAVEFMHHKWLMMRSRIHLLGDANNLGVARAAFSLAKEDEIDENAQYHQRHDYWLQVFRIKEPRGNCLGCGSTMTAMMIDDGKRVAADGARLQWHMIPIADIDLIARNTRGEENGLR